MGTPPSDGLKVIAKKKENIVFVYKIMRISEIGVIFVKHILNQTCILPHLNWIDLKNQPAFILSQDRALDADIFAQMIGSNEGQIQF